MLTPNTNYLSLLRTKSLHIWSEKVSPVRSAREKREENKKTNQTKTEKKNGVRQVDFKDGEKGRVG